MISQSLRAIKTHNSQQLAYQLIQQALADKASDIHIEAHQDNYKIRWRIDGLLHPIMSLETHHAYSLISHLKVLAKVDIAERRLPQDGQLILPHQPCDIRLSTCPTVHGEKVVLRLINTNQHRDIAELLPDQQQLQTVRQWILQPQGLILITGPTGSGKTSTLYSLLSALNNHDKNILTIEDPIEIKLPGINQTSVNRKSGLGFADSLRAFLRQDPDIIMIGEIRDLETAQIAIRAAQTGHLVLATLHTNSAIATLSRLYHMGIQPHELAYYLTGIMAQRLVRKLCQNCKQKGCQFCHQGFHGRFALSETLTVSQTIRQMIIQQASEQDLLETAQKQNFRTLATMAQLAISENRTTTNEIERTLGTATTHA